VRRSTLDESVATFDAGGIPAATVSTAARRQQQGGGQADPNAVHGELLDLRRPASDADPDRCMEGMGGHRRKSFAFEVIGVHFGELDPIPRIRRKNPEFAKGPTEPDTTVGETEAGA
jgi:hypothetical protein